MKINNNLMNFYLKIKRRFTINEPPHLPHKNSHSNSQIRQICHPVHRRMQRSQQAQTVDLQSCILRIHHHMLKKCIYRRLQGCQRLKAAREGLQNPTLACP